MTAEFISCWQRESYPKRDDVLGENEIGHLIKRIPREWLQSVIKDGSELSHVGNNIHTRLPTG